MKSTKLVGLLIVAVAAAAVIWQFNRMPTSADSRPSAHRNQGTICVIQYVSHPLLDAVYLGFREELGRQHYPLDQITYENANGDATATAILADRVSKGRYDIVFALGTPIAQAVKNACPPGQRILFGAITDPISAGLVSSMESPGENITGTSDQWPYDLQMRLIASVWKSATVGVPLNPAEANTTFAMEQIRKSAQRNGLKLREVPINSLTEAAQVVDAVKSDVKVIYIPADNTAVAAAPGIIASANRAGIPVIAGDPGTFEAGAVFGIGVDYSNLGVLNGEQVMAILGGASPGSLSVAISNRPELYINEKRAAEFAIDVAAVRAWYASAVK